MSQGSLLSLNIFLNVDFNIVFEVLHCLEGMRKRLSVSKAF